MKTYQTINLDGSTNWPEFAASLNDEEWMKANPPWPIGSEPKDEEEAKRRFWPWPLDSKDE